MISKITRPDVRCFQMGAVSKIDVHRESSLGWIDFLSESGLMPCIQYFPYVIAQIDDPQRMDDRECCAFDRSVKNKNLAP